MTPPMNKVARPEGLASSLTGGRSSRRLVTLDVWETIRIRCVRDREPRKHVARELGISKNTVKKYMESHSVPQVKNDASSP